MRHTLHKVTAYTWVLLVTFSLQWDILAYDFNIATFMREPFDNFSLLTDMTQKLVQRALKIISYPGSLSPVTRGWISWLNFGRLFCSEKASDFAFVSGQSTVPSGYSTSVNSSLKSSKNLSIFEMWPLSASKLRLRKMWQLSCRNHPINGTLRNGAWLWSEPIQIYK